MRPGDQRARVLVVLAEHGGGQAVLRHQGAPRAYSKPGRPRSPLTGGDTFRSWRGADGAAEYEDVPGYCASVRVADIKAADYALTPGRYVGAAEVADDGEPLDEKVQRLKKELFEAMNKSERLGAVVRDQLELLSCAETRTGGREAAKGVVPGRVALSVGRPELPEPQGFHWRSLSELARLESGHTPARSRPDYWGGDVPWVGIRDATGNHGRIIDETLSCVAQEGLENSSARLLPQGTVCLSRTASVGYTIQMGQPMATSQEFVNWVCGPDLNGSYLRYVLMLEQESIRERFARGSTHRTMYCPEAKALHVPAPKRCGQDAIVDVLGALDDKIAANERVRSHALELARTSFARELAGLQSVGHLSLGELGARGWLILSDGYRTKAREYGLPGLPIQLTARPSSLL